MQQPVSLPSIRELFPNHNFSDNQQNQDATRQPHPLRASPTTSTAPYPSAPSPYSPHYLSSGTWTDTSYSSRHPPYSTSPFSTTFPQGIPSPSSATAYEDDYYPRTAPVDRRKVAPRRSNGDFKSHNNVEPDIRKHKCTQCSKCFNRPSSLRIHINTHTGATPFQCPYPNCGRLFNVNSNMRRHYRNHRPIVDNPNAQLPMSESGDEDDGDMSDASDGETMKSP